jgi:ABC-2 type transport system permease protein
MNFLNKISLKINEIRRSISKASRLYYLFQRQNVSRFLSYRISTTISSAWLFIWVFIDLFFFKSIFSVSTSIAGWNYWDCILLMLAIAIFWDIFWRVTSGGLYKIPREIFKGNIDHILLKPYNEIFLLNYSGLSSNQSINTVLLAGYYILNQGITFTFSQSLQALILIILAVGLASWAFILISSLAFWITDTYLLEKSFWALTSISRYPKDIFQGFWHNLFTFILPIFFIANFPVEFLRGNGNSLLILLGIGLNILFGGLALTVWRKGLKQYAGQGN